MIENDEQFKETFKEYVKSKGIEYDNFCRGIDCEDCILGNLDIYCDGEPFKAIEEYNEKIRLLRKEIEIMGKEIEIMEMWKRENSSSAKETWEEEEEKTYAEVQRLLAKMGELTKEVARLYRKLDQMEKGVMV